MPMTLLFLVSSAFAQEADFASLMTTARQAILAKDWDAANAALKAAEAAAPASATLISNADLARITFYQGVVVYRTEGVDPAMAVWRKTLVIAGDFAPEKDVLPEADAQDVFYALAEEQRNKEQVALGLPEDPGDVMIFVDGRRYEPLDSVYLGQHFVQLRCAEGNLVGSWYTFGAPPPDWLAPCNGGSYPQPVVDGKKPKEKKPREPKEKKSGDDGDGGGAAGIVLLGVGGAMVAGGVVTNFVMVNPAWEDIQAANEAPGSVSREDADAMESRFGTGRYVTLGLLGLGTTLAATGLVVTLVDDTAGLPSVNLGFSPNGVLLSGSW